MAPAQFWRAANLKFACPHAIIGGMPAPIYQERLSNGLTLLIYPLPHFHTVSINIRTDSGARREEDVQQGLAHLVEHLLFQGTPQRPTNFMLTSQVEALGGALWGATHTEYGSYWLHTPQEYLLRSAPLLLEMLRTPLLAADQVEDEKNVILDEIGETQSDLWHVTQTQLDRALWPDHPLGRSVLGQADALRHLTQADVHAFHKRYFTPQSMVAVVAGNVEPEHIRTLFQTHWGDWHPSVSLPPLTPPAARPSRALLSRAHANEIAHVMLGIPIPPLNDPDAGAYAILRTMLAEGMSSRLYTRLRSQANLCYSIGTELDELRHACVWAVYFTVQPDDVTRAIDLVCDELAALRACHITPDEIERSRGQAIGKLLIEADKVDAQAHYLALSAFLTGEPIPIAQSIDQLRRVTEDDVYRVAATLRPEQVYASAVGPITPPDWEQIERRLAEW